MKEIYQKTSAYVFIKRVAIHAVALWLAVNIFSWVNHIYKVKFNLAYSRDPHGLLVSFKDSFINHNLNQPTVFWVLVLALLAEANFLFVFRPKKLGWFLLSSIGCGIAGGCAVSQVFVRHYAYYPVAAQFVEAALLIIVYVAGYAILHNFFYERYQRIQYYRQKSEAELHLLKAQINPHFFFNTLNNIYGMALGENAVKTAGAIELLSDMMRYNMDGIREDFIKLDDELKFVENYLALQELRVPQKENISIKTTIEYPKIRYKIAPMLLMPFIENAWKYGISMEKPSYISLGIKVEDHQLVMEAVNSIFTNEENKAGSKLGLDNVKQRLQLIYPGLHQLSVQNDGNNYRVKLTIVLS